MRTASATRSVRREFPLLGVQRLGGEGGCVGQFGHVAEPPALGQEPLLVTCLHPLGAGNELLELGQALRAAGGIPGELLPEAPRGDEVSPRTPQLGAAAQLLLADEGIEHVELVRGAGEPALLELPGHGEQPLDECGQVLPRDGAPPRIRARAPVGEHAARGHEPLLPCRPQLGDGSVVRVVQDAVGQVELRLDVGLLGAGPEVAGVAGGAQQESDGLGEDRLSRPGLPRDRIQAGREDEVGLADEDEALDRSRLSIWGRPW